MSAYRQASEPARSASVIVLRPSRARRVVLGICMRVMTVWFLVWPVAWIARALLTGEDAWRVLLAPPLWLAIVGLNARITQLETLTLGTHTLTRRGVFRSRSIDWATIRGFRHWSKPGYKGSRISMLTIEGEHGDLSFPAFAVLDPGSTLRWALDHAVAGKLGAIDERVRRDGGPLSVRAPYLAHAAVALLLSLLLAFVVVPGELRRHGEHRLRATRSMPYAERIETLRDVSTSVLFNSRTQCRAHNMLTSGEVSPMVDTGEDMFALRLPRAIEYCEAMRAAGCPQRAFGRDCRALTEMKAAADAWHRGDAAEALRHLEESSLRGLVRHAIEIPARRALGQDAQANTLAAACLASFGGSTAPAVQRLLGACR